jgi:hypothetical protein
MGILPNGAFQLGSQGIRFAQITDGLSNTLLAGEKHVPLGTFGVGWLDSSTYNGDYPTCSTRCAGPGYELATSPRDTGWRFGSYHPSVCQFVLADGSVRIIPVTTSSRTLGRLAGISDGEPVPDY